MITIDKNKNQNPQHVVSNYCQAFLQDLKTSDISISKQTMNLIKNKATIITHSNSSTVLNTILYTKKYGPQFSVICTESRPKNEGIYMAKQLGKNGIQVKLVVDSAVFSFISEADMILVGGDAITNTGLINKIGTKGIAITAQHYQTPLYALCSTTKFIPQNYQMVLNNQKNPKEITNAKLSNVTPLNYYFDLTPLEFITGFITEKEILKPPEIKEKIQNLQFHKDFAKKHL
jgi:translation initiation factor 2B subunit (eIF-2B alpha/beta/delta family)